MQPHIKSAATRKNSSNVTTAVIDRRIANRRWTADFVVTRYIVVLNLGPVCRAELTNESKDGIAIQVRELDSPIRIGHPVDVIYCGKRHSAEVQRITENENGFLVGLDWK
mgnify:CR=1 FL=1